MNRRPLLLTGAALFLSIAAACSSSSSDGAAPGGGGDQDAGDQGDDGGGSSDAATTKPTKVGEDCTSTAVCSAGQECITISHHGGQAICMATCKGSSTTCPGSSTCENDICQPTCSDGCPKAMTCITDINACMFDCDQNTKLCGPGEMCSQSIECVPAVADAGPLVCAPGGGTASSGITGTKTVGSLTSTEQATFCDWAAAVTGGYGCEGQCDGGISTSFSASQSTCTSQFTKSGCAATVSDVEACVKENAQDVCGLAVLHSATCASLRACL